MVKLSITDSVFYSTVSDLLLASSESDDLWSAGVSVSIDRCDGDGVRRSFDGDGALIANGDGDPLCAIPRLYGVAVGICGLGNVNQGVGT